MKKFLTTLLCAATIAFAPVAAKAAPIEAGALDFPPYYQVTPEGVIKGGLYVDMVKQVLERAKIEYTYKGYPAKRLYTNLADGLTNVWMGTVGVTEYEGKTLVSPEKTSEIHLTVYGLGDQELPKTMDELKGKTLITIFGFNYGGVIKFLEDPANKITTEPAKGHDLAFKMLKAGRAPLVLDYEEPAGEALKTEPVPGIKKSVIKTVPIYFHVSKATPNAQEVLDKMVKAYNELKAEGKF